MLKLIALAAAAATTTAPAALVSTSPWWEKVTVTMAGNGDPRSCQYESSSLSTGAQQCEVEGDSNPVKTSGSVDEVTSITFERRFSPGAQPDKGDVQPGDTLLGGQVMALKIDATGAVRGCEVVATAGTMTPDYGCAEAKAEKFEASARSSETPHQAYLTILVYAHAENVA